MGGVTHLGCVQWAVVVVVDGSSSGGRQWVVVVMMGCGGERGSR